ncbi:5-oxoprolinase subunit PxpB [Peribacillus muralis]|uniref:5-oxoprolinase subunit PxpB n=1 Tax=Peribacillus muralis TaxID=264697 RepID=UPI001F4E9845|nr:5-oxoprolinase subunit PxpB [Peribacillus muralis]MCK1993714.1 5-oxoprolinase subunit PxpB [Peribacillus muralis]MCK2013997.1 5-oxoprolinase subunit PxpB [Peribacillus muralis]
MPKNLLNETACNMSPLGDSAIVITFGNGIDYSVHKKIKLFMDLLEEDPFAGFVECVPAFTNLTVFYDPLVIYNTHKSSNESISPYEVVWSLLEGKLSDSIEDKKLSHRTVSIPVCYGGEFGPDLDYVARYHDLTTDEVIHIHSTGEYLAYMIGFAPGFPFLGGLSENIATPRRSSPRMTIPAGAVGIAGKQTGVYPISTPGGWQLIGQTPAKLFLPNVNPPSLLQAGDMVKFQPISEQEYKEIKGGSDESSHNQAGIID